VATIAHQPSSTSSRAAPWARLASLASILVVLACAPSAAPPAKPASAPAAQPPAAVAPSGAPSAAGAPAPSTPPNPISVRIAYASPGAALAPIWVAQEQGLLREHGLDAELVFLSGTRTDQGVISGETPIGFGTNVVTSRLGGAEVVAIADVVSRITAIMFARPGIADMQGLRGKTVSSTLPGATISLATALVLRHYGLEPNRDVTVLNTGGSVEKFNLVVQGHADATLLSPPDDLKALEQGLSPIANISDLNIPLVYTAVGTTTTYARDHAEELRRFLRAYVAAVALARRDPATTLPIIGKYTQTDDLAVVEHAYRFYRDVWGRPDFRVPPAAIASSLRMLDTPGADTAKPEDFIDNRFVDELERSGFLRQVNPFD
jgi:NitT/TauT family transport system substrate-binding protein